MMQSDAVTISESQVQATKSSTKINQSNTENRRRNFNLQPSRQRLTSRRFGGRVTLQRDLAGPPLALPRGFPGALGLVVGGFGATRMVHLQVEGTHGLHAGSGDFGPGVVGDGRFGGGDDVRRADLAQRFLEVLQEAHPGPGALQLDVLVLQLEPRTGCSGLEVVVGGAVLVDVLG